MRQTDTPRLARPLVNLVTQQNRPATPGSGFIWSCVGEKAGIQKGRRACGLSGYGSVKTELNNLTVITFI